MTTEHRIAELESLIENADPGLSMAWDAFLGAKRIIDADPDGNLGLMAEMTSNPIYLEAVQFMSPLCAELAALKVFNVIQSI